MENSGGVQLSLPEFGFFPFRRCSLVLSVQRVLISAVRRSISSGVGGGWGRCILEFLPFGGMAMPSSPYVRWGKEKEPKEQCLIVEYIIAVCQLMLVVLSFEKAPLYKKKPDWSGPA